MEWRERQNIRRGPKIVYDTSSPEKYLKSLVPDLYLEEIYTKSARRRPPILCQLSVVSLVQLILVCPV